jgi:hypothetical protein
MNQPRRGYNTRRLWASVLLAIGYGGLLLYLQTLTGINTLDGIIGVLLGLYICSHPAAHMLDLLYMAHGARQQLLSGGSGMWWLALNILALLAGLITITIGAHRFVEPASVSLYQSW